MGLSRSVAGWCVMLLVAALWSGCRSLESRFFQELDGAEILYPPSPLWQEEPISSSLKRTESDCNAVLKTPITFRYFDSSGQEIPLEVIPFHRDFGMTAVVLKTSVLQLPEHLEYFDGLKYELDAETREIRFYEQ